MTLTLRQIWTAFSAETRQAILLDMPVIGPRSMPPEIQASVTKDLTTALPPITPAEIQAIIALIVQLLPVILALFGGG